MTQPITMEDVREGIKSFSEAEREMLEERAAIMEFDGGLSKREAALKAYIRVCLARGKESK